MKRNLIQNLRPDAVRVLVNFGRHDLDGILPETVAYMRERGLIQEVTNLINGEKGVDPD